MKSFPGLLLMIISSVVRSEETFVVADCNAFSSCAACTTARYDATELRSFSCSWNTRRSSCIHHAKGEADNDTMIYFEYDCPLGPNPYPNKPPEFLPDWMSAFYQAHLLNTVPLVHLCLPGTHDSLSHDLSLTVSAEGFGKMHTLSVLLHTLSGGRVQILPGQLEDFFRTQAKTQQLSLTQQLDNGIRFIDFRLMRQPDDGRWYSIHFMQTKHTVETYWLQIRDWLNLHPEEVVVLWLSRDGNPAATGNEQYPDVTSEQKHAIWKNFTTIFDGFLLNTSRANIFSDSLASLIEHNYRLIPFVADYQDFTMSSPLALNAANIQNIWNEGSVFDEGRRTSHLQKYFQNAKANNAAVNKRHGFTLLGMNTASPEWQIVASAEKRFLGWKGDKIKRCSTKFNMPNTTHWCPETLLDIAQLSSYYVQTLLEYVYNGMESTDLAFPNAIYLDALDWDGTIRTGPQLLNGHDRGGDPENKVTSYSYVHTILSYNAYIACAKQPSDGVCELFKEKIKWRKQFYPHVKWDDHNLARYSSWPSLKIGEMESLLSEEI